MFFPLSFKTDSFPILQNPRTLVFDIVLNLWPVFFQRWEINQEKKVTTLYVVLLLIWVFASFYIVGLKKTSKNN